jgi:hypothetical protein
MPEKHIPKFAKSPVDVKETPHKDVPARDAFHHHAIKDLQSKLSECFRRMDEREVDTKFSIGDTDLRVRGFRARKGITISGAYTEIAGFGGESGGTAAIHLQTGLFLKVARYNAFHKPHAAMRANLIRPEVVDQLRGREEFQNLISLLDFLGSQNIKYSFTIARVGDENYASDTRKKYELALRVKTLEKEGSTPEEAVKKVLSESKSPSLLLSQLNEHNLKPEARFLAGITREPSESHFDNLLFIWSNHPPANPEDIAFAIAGIDAEKVKKFFEKAIADKNAEIAKKTAEVDKLKEQMQLHAGTSLARNLEEDIADKKWELREETTHLENLGKAYKVLCSCKRT